MTSSVTHKNDSAHKAQGAAFFIGESLGGLASMLVALPSAIAYGLLIYSSLGAEFGAKGVMAGITGSILLGMIAPILGGAKRLISAPCAPAAAVLSALVIELLKSENTVFPVELIPTLILFVALLSAVFQFTYGIIGGGRLIKYIPYPVVAGYLSGVGVLILISQVPKFLGVSKSIGFWHGLTSPELWKWQGVVVGLVTIIVMIYAPKVTKAVPAAILALIAGFITYFIQAGLDPALATLSGNSLIIGPIGGDGGIHFFNPMTDGLSLITSLNANNIHLLFVPALTLSVLLSIDTLKTCVILDALTRSRHNANRELIGQGVGNLVSGFFGGMPGAGTMGATLVNLNSGGSSRLSGVLAGVFALLAFLVLGNLVAWVPISALAAILFVVGYRMIDKNTFRLLTQRSTIFDFIVVAAVVITAVASNLIAAAGLGVGLAILIFLREQIQGTVIHRKAFGNQVFSKKRRLPDEVAVLEAKGNKTALFELQGNLFFGTTEQLFAEIGPCLTKCKYVILNLRRIRSLDFTAVHLLEQFEAQLAETGGSLIFSNLPSNLPGGKNLFAYFDHMGLVKPTLNVQVFVDQDDALEWAEDQVLEAEKALSQDNAPPLELSQIDAMSDLPPEDLKSLQSCISEKSYSASEKIFKQNDSGDQIFFIRKGVVKIMLPIGTGGAYHLATFSRGDFFGDMSFLDQGHRSADAVAATPVSLYSISRAKFDEVNAKFPRIGGNLFARLAYTLAIRLRQTDSELQVLQE